LLPVKSIKQAAIGLALHGYIGIALIAVCWPLNWLLPGNRTAYLFFPLWLGYVLVIDALVYMRTGSSISTRSQTEFVLLFIISAPAWWLFEIINWRTQNWVYLGTDSFGVLVSHVLSTLSFSTVMPAVFASAELMRSFSWIDRFANGPRIRPSVGLCTTLFLVGLAMLLLTLGWPRWFYPFVWTSLALMLEPINRWLGNPHLLERLAQGDWRPVAALCAGALLCGFFWELWNYYSYPKWIYRTPGAQFLHIFEMPLLGYGGYLPFALELYGLKNLLLPRATVPRI